MKILMLSIFSSHFFNWTEQLRDSGHEIYWLDVFDSNTKVEKIGFVHQIIGWRYKCDYPGRHFLKKNLPGLTRLINQWNERKLDNVLEEKIKKIQPDVVHSFVMYLSTVPVLTVMKKHPELKWIFSSWGSDLFYYSQKEDHLLEIKKVLPQLDYMFSDCKRDHLFALRHGFNGEFLGVFPGGGGYDFKVTDSLMQPIEERNIILIKGYQGLHGKCVEVLKAIESIKEEFFQVEIVVFGAAEEIIEYCESSDLKTWKNFKVLKFIPHHRVLELMGKSRVYIGNSTSDGMPNTLLEAIIMGAFPIQSNPGGATSEVIQKGKNGFLIDHPEDSEEIAALLKKIIEAPQLIKSGVEYNSQHIKPKLDREYVKQQVLEKYKLVEKNLRV